MTAALAYPFDPDGTGMTSAQTIDAMWRELALLNRRAAAIRAALATLEVEPLPNVMEPLPPRAVKPRNIRARIAAVLAEAYEPLSAQAIALAAGIGVAAVRAELAAMGRADEAIRVGQRWVGA